MSDVKIDLSELADFTPTEGIGSSGLLKFDGAYKTVISKAQVKVSSAGNPMLLLVQIVQDADEKGQQLLNNVLAGGKDHKGKSMIRQLGEVLVSIGKTTEQIHAFAANGVVDADEVAKALINKEAYVLVKAETYEGRMSSKVDNFITKQRYEDAVAANAHRRPRAADVSYASAPQAPASQANVGGPAATTAPTNGAAGVQNPMARLQGLGIQL